MLILNKISLLFRVKKILFVLAVTERFIFCESEMAIGMILTFLHYNALY